MGSVTAAASDGLNDLGDRISRAPGRSAGIERESSARPSPRARARGRGSRGPLEGSTASAIANLALYEIGWFACILGAASGWGGTGAAVAFGLVAVHIVLAERADLEWPLLVIAGLLGIAVDSLNARFGVLQFSGHEPGTLAPVWILALWVQFGTVFHFCLRWLSKRYLLASVLGLVGGPLAFLGGERLGAATFGEPRALSLAILGLTWGIVLPTLVLIADRLGGAGRYRLPATMGASSRGSE